MTVYLLFLLYVFIVNFIFNPKIKKEKKIAIFLSCLGLFLLQALRKDTVGIDLQGYKNFFYTISSLSYKENLLNNPFKLEYGYIIFNKALSFFSTDFKIVIFSTALILSIILGYFVYKYSEVPLTSFLLFFGLGLFVFSFSGLRQVLAIAFTILAFDKYVNKKYFLCLIWIGIAFFFHKSAIIFLIIFPLNFIKINVKSLYIIIPIMVLIILKAKSLMILFIRLILPDYLHYVTSEHSFGYLGLFLSVTYIFCLLFSYRKKEEQKISIIRNLTLIGALVQLFGNVSTVTGRVTFYFIPYFIILIPYTFKIGSKDKLTYRILNISYCSFVLIALLLPSLIKGYLNITPYQFFWQ